MTILSDKLKEYFVSMHINSTHMHRDIAKICQDEYRKCDCLGECEPYNTIEKLEKEIVELKEELKIANEQILFYSNDNSGFMIGGKL